ncbi:MAG: peptidylprolyl isomerase [Candidatus Omnitrophota bacterium]|nr:peptidylprolyl isomerase [Candidatus Omnitrophota bacterium]
MLKQMRKNSRIFLYILIVAFIAWLAFDAINTAQRNPYAGSIFGKKILINEYQKAYIAAKTKAILTYGDRIRDVQKDLNLEDDAWNRLILLSEAKKQKIRVGDKEIVDFIKGIGIFHDKNGKFSNSLYEQILRYSLGLTPVEFEEQVRGDLTIQKLIEKENQKVALTDEDVLKEYKFVNEKAKADYILFKAQDYLAQAVCTEDEIKSYFEKNKTAFNLPEQVNVQYIGKGFPVNTDEEKNKIRKEMKDISYELAGEKELEGVAKKFSLPVKETGFFDRETKIPDIGWDLQFANSALSLQTGDISGLIETKTGVYILKVKEKKPARQAEFAQVKEKAEKFLRAEKAAEIAKAKATEALSAIKARLEKKEKFEDITKNLSLTVKDTDAFTRNSYIQGLGVTPEFAKAVFSLKEGEVFGEPVKTHDGYAIARQTALIPIDENKYKEEKDKFREQLLAQKKYFNSMSWFFELKKRSDLRSNPDNFQSGRK